MASPVELAATVLAAGLGEMLSYLTLHVVTCLVPAFFIAGAISALVSDRIVLQYLGRDARPLHAYGLASISGIALAVCSCTILPMFAGLYKKGAGIGPATAFLFSGPAINVLAIVFTARILGLRLGLARAVFAVGMAAVIGLAMAWAFGRESKTTTGESAPTTLPDGGTAPAERPAWVTGAFLLALVAVLLVAATGMLDWTVKSVVLVGLFAVLAWLLRAGFERWEILDWLSETRWFARMIVPLLLIGTFVIGMIGAIAALFQGLDPFAPVTFGGSTFPAYKVAPGLLTRQLFGATTLTSTAAASVVGAVLYMPTLLEVPIVGDLFGYTQGLMDSGPALALLLAGPSLSLPNMIVIWRTIGTRRSAGYIGLVLVGATAIGLAWGVLV
ncbi:MAG: permease [Halodesulfurarchaeum sp.]